MQWVPSFIPAASVAVVSTLQGCTVLAEGWWGEWRPVLTSDMSWWRLPPDWTPALLPAKARHRGRLPEAPSPVGLSLPAPVLGVLGASLRRGHIHSSSINMGLTRGKPV